VGLGSSRYARLTAQGLKNGNDEEKERVWLGTERGGGMGRDNLKRIKKLLWKRTTVGASVGALRGKTGEGGGATLRWACPSGREGKKKL